MVTRTCAAVDCGFVDEEDQLWGVTTAVNVGDEVVRTEVLFFCDKHFEAEVQDIKQQGWKDITIELERKELP